MLIIRLQRTGRSNTPAYRIVLADKRRSAKGHFQEMLGHYLPAREPTVLEYNEERILEWVKKGAQVSDTVARMLTKKGVKGLEKFFVRYAHQKSKSEPEEQPAAPAAAAPVEAPKEEKKEEPAPAAEAPKEEQTPPAEAPKEEPAPAEAPPAPAAEGGDSEPKAE